MFSKIPSKIIALTAIGGMLEFYDFTIYALFAPYLSEYYLPWNIRQFNIAGTLPALF